MVFRHGTSGTSVSTGNDLGRTDRDIDDFNGLNSWLWWDTIWWHDQVTGTGDTVIRRIDTGGTFFVTDYTYGFVRNGVVSMGTVTGWWGNSVGISGTFTTVGHVSVTS